MGSSLPAIAYREHHEFFQSLPPAMGVADA